MVSLFTDAASEMLYPVMPIYLKSIGFSVVLIGILEGIAEATAGFSKGYFGKLSDVSGKRVPFVQIGYAFSAISKPMMGLFIYPAWIFLARTIDRFGKGIRTGARDAILSDDATPGTKGKIFGFHRSMDTLGAVIETGVCFSSTATLIDVHRSGGIGRVVLNVREPVESPSWTEIRVRENLGECRPDPRGPSCTLVTGRRTPSG